MTIYRIQPFQVAYYVNAVDGGDARRCLIALGFVVPGHTPVEEVSHASGQHLIVTVAQRRAAGALFKSDTPAKESEQAARVPRENNYINPEDHPGIQAHAILAGNAYPVMGRSEDIPAVAQLQADQFQEVLVAEENVAEAYKALEEAQKQLTIRESRARHLSKYLNGLIREAGKEALRKSREG